MDGDFLLSSIRQIKHNVNSFSHRVVMTTTTSTRRGALKPNYNNAEHGRDIENVRAKRWQTLAPLPPRFGSATWPKITAAIYVYVTRKFCGCRIFIVQVRRLRLQKRKKQTKIKFGLHGYLRTASLAGKNLGLFMGLNLEAERKQGKRQNETTGTALPDLAIPCI